MWAKTNTTSVRFWAVQASRRHTLVAVIFRTRPEENRLRGAQRHFPKGKSQKTWLSGVGGGSDSAWWNQITSRCLQLHAPTSSPPHPLLNGQQKNGGGSEERSANWRIHPRSAAQQARECAGKCYHRWQREIGFPDTPRLTQELEGNVMGTSNSLQVPSVFTPLLMSNFKTLRCADKTLFRTE